MRRGERQWEREQGAGNKESDERRETMGKRTGSKEQRIRKGGEKGERRWEREQGTGHEIRRGER